MVIILFALAIVMFLITLNGFLRGAKRAQLDAILGGTWIILLVLTFWKFGWKSALILDPVSNH